MRKAVLPIMIAVLGIVSARAETTETLSSSGTIREFEPGTTLIIEQDGEMVTYRIAENVTYVNKAGKSITAERASLRLRAGMPVTVHYTTRDEARVVSRIEIGEEGSDSGEAAEEEAEGNR